MASILSASTSPARPGRDRALAPRTEPARGDTEQTAHRGHRVPGPVHALRPRRLRRHRAGLPGDTQAAAFARISRSSFSWRLSHRGRRSSSRSGLLRPSARRPASRSACRTRLRIVSADGPSSRAGACGLRPARCRLHHLPAELRRARSSTLCHRTHLLSSQSFRCPRKRVGASGALVRRRTPLRARWRRTVRGSRPGPCAGPRPSPTGPPCRTASLRLGFPAGGAIRAMRGEMDAAGARAAVC